LPGFQQETQKKSKSFIRCRTTKDGQRVFFAIHNGKQARLATASLKPTGTETLVKGMPLLSFAANWATVRDGVYFYPADSPGTLSYFDFAIEEVRPSLK